MIQKVRGLLRISGLILDRIREERLITFVPWCRSSKHQVTLYHPRPENLRLIVFTTDIRIYVAEKERERLIIINGKKK